MVSIIIPCFNYARFLPDAIDSALKQQVDGMEGEVLVIDDGSTDNTPAVVSKYGERVRYIRQINAGLSATRNRGMREAANDYVVFLDADDLLLPGAVNGLWEAMQRHSSKVAIMAGREQVVNSNCQPTGPIPDPETGQVNEISARDLVLRNRFAPAVLADRRVLLEAGGFDTSLRASEDRDMWIRVAAKHRVAKVDKFTLWKRDHGGNMSRAALQQTACIRQVLAKVEMNADLKLQPADLRTADAVCWYQSALMFAEAGEAREAMWRMFRSVSAVPWVRSQETGILFLSRSRAIASLMAAMLKNHVACLRRTATSVRL